MANGDFEEEQKHKSWYGVGLPQWPSSPKVLAGQGPQQRMAGNKKLDIKRAVRTVDADKS